MPLDSGKAPAPSDAPAAADWPPDRVLETDGGHRVWWTEGGDPRGHPVLLVHGGPGGRSRIETTAWWRGLAVRWIAIDQRGCGRSTPAGRLTDNTLDGLLDDMDRLRERLGLAKWSIAAGSWGATVALASLLRDPSSVGGLFLRSPFLASRAELARYVAPWRDWLGPAGRDRLGEDVDRFERWLLEPAPLGMGEHCDVAPDVADAPVDESRLAEAWAGFDDQQAQPGGVRAAGAVWQPAEDARAPPDAWRVFAHYARHGWFLREPLVPALEARAAHLRERPLAVVCGARDACCDPALGHWLAEWHGASQAIQVVEGGHRMDHPAMATAIARTAREWVAALGSPAGEPRR